MNTLEKQITKVLKDNNCYLNPDLITLSEAAEYIDMTNENDKDYYSPEDWFKDTKANFPEYLLNMDELQKKYYPTILEYLATQRELCIDQTGLEPCFEDYENGMDCDDFRKNLINSDLEPEYCEVKVIDLFNYLLDYWNKN